MARLNKKNFLDYSFYTSIIIKGLEGVVETISGVLLYFFSVSVIQNITVLLTRHELAQEANDFIANWLLYQSQQLSVSFKTFLAFYLFSHGVIKIFLVINLLYRKLWSYPLAIVFLISFVLYQTYRLMYSYSIALLLLTIFDVLAILLTGYEYRKVKKHQKTS